MDDEITTRIDNGITRTAAIFLAIAAILLGLIAGTIGHSIFSEPVVVIPPPEVIKEELTETELRALASDLIATEQDRAQQAIERVQTLQEELAFKEAELEKFKNAKAKNTARRGQLQEEIAFLQIQLASAEEERESLRKELKQTIKELDFQVVQTKNFKRKAKQYKMESTTNLWGAFLANSKVKICDRGTRKRHEKCHDAVEDALNSQMRGRFTVCVDTYQSVPVLKQAQREDPLPRYAARLNEENKFTKKGWYILFCDPTLPEAGDQELKGDDVPTWKSTYGVDEELGLDNNDYPPSNGYNAAPTGGRQEMDEPIEEDEMLEDELNLDDLDLNFD